MRNAVVCALAIAATSLPAAAAKDDTNQLKDPLFQRLDVNHDGYVSRSEAAAQRDFGQAFTEADDNHDGRLDRDEFVKAQSVYERMRAAAYLDDSVITAKVKAALIKDPEVKALEVSVETSKGVVLLSGFVDNERQIRRAQELAGAIEGVKSVRASLIVKD
jgi:hyperosmotically inducible protein